MVGLANLVDAHVGEFGFDGVGVPFAAFIEQTSVIITTNLSFSDWASVFGAEAAQPLRN